MEKTSVICSTPWKPDGNCLSLLWKGSLLAFLISCHQEPPCIWYKMLLYSFTMSNAIMMLIASSGLYTCFTDYCYLPRINYTDKVLTKLILTRQKYIWAFILWAISTANTLSGSWRYSFIHIVSADYIRHTYIRQRKITVLRLKMFLRRSFSGLYSSLNIQVYRLF